MRCFPITPCRYVRLTAVEPFINNFGPIKGSQFGAAEIELFSEGRNVALGRPIQADFTTNLPERSFSALTDGRSARSSPRNWNIAMHDRKPTSTGWAG